MRRLLACWSLLICALVLQACQAVPEDALQEVYPVYRTEAQAMAVAAGQIGAAPMLLLSRSEADTVMERGRVDGVSLASRGPEALVWQLTLPDGRIGWAPKSTWP